MTTESDALAALGRRAVACKAWRWMPGMRDTYGTRVLAVLPDGRLRTSELVSETYAGATLAEHEVSAPADMMEPDLADPATLGCVEALVREAHGEPEAVAVTTTLGRLTGNYDADEWDAVRWVVLEDANAVYWWRESSIGDPPLGSGATREDAWVRALELAPGGGGT
jgi:hypothetical protein